MANTPYVTQTLWQRINGRHGQYVTRRQRYDAQREAIVEYLRPDLVAGEVGSKDEGAFEGSSIVEGTAPHALLIWERGFLSNLVSRKIEWFREQAKEPPAWTGVTFKGNDQVNKYAQELAEHMADLYRRSTYYPAMRPFTRNGGSVGSPVMLFQQDVARDRMVCEVPDYASVWLDKDIFGEDNCLHVLREWDALQAAQFFGKNQLPRAVQRQLENGEHYAKTKYLQTVYGAGDPIYQDLPDRESVPQTHPWLEHFICLSADPTEQKALKPRHGGPGYFTRPFSSWHYDRNDHEVYSRTMAWWAIFDVRGLNALWEGTFGEVDMSLRPPFWAMESLRGLLDLAPGRGSYARNPQEYQTPPVFLDRHTRYDTAIDFVDRMTEAVRRHFHYPFFMNINQIIAAKTQPETAFGLARAQAENGVQLIEEIEAFEQQVLGHTHDVFLDYEIRKAPAYPWGALPQPPDILLEYGDGNMDVEFIGPLSMMEINNRQVERFYRSMEPAQLVFATQPETIHKLKWPQILEHLLESQNFRQDDIVSEEEYDQIVAGVRQRALQQELAEAMPKMTQGVKNMQGKTEKGSPMAMMMGGRQ